MWMFWVSPMAWAQRSLAISEMTSDDWKLKTPEETVDYGEVGTGDLTCRYLEAYVEILLTSCFVCISSPRQQTLDEFNGSSSHK